MTPETKALFWLVIVPLYTALAVFFLAAAMRDRRQRRTRGTRPSTRTIRSANHAAAVRAGTASKRSV
jgi:hypothetical protein